MPPATHASESTSEPSQVQAQIQARRAIRWLWAIVGAIALALGFVGIVVPGMPTTVFWLIAAWCFSRSCPAIQRWIYNRPRVGPVIEDLLEHRKLTPANRRRAIGGIWFGIGLSAAIMLLTHAPHWAVGILLLTAVGVTTWVRFGFREA